MASGDAKLTRFYGAELGHSFFEELAKPTQWLSTEHMEQTLAIFRGNVKSDPKRFEDVVVMDSYWPCLVEKERVTHKAAPMAYSVDAHMLAYLDGTSPALMGKRWADAKTILALVNLRKKHWVVMEIFLEEWQVKLYDPDTAFIRDRQLAVELLYVTELLPRIIAAHLPLSSRYADKLPKAFGLSCIHGVPKNTQSGDCGAYTLRFIEKRVEGDMEFAELDDAFIQHYRYMLAAKIFSYCHLIVSAPPHVDPTPSTTS